MAAPLPICFLNGDYLALAEARVSPLDRAFLFADSVYEVVPVFACASIWTGSIAVWQALVCRHPCRTPAGPACARS
jgi:branched-subunit amino acid aminotransferase/4-amino-4-deoxychorismate lyase